jgi:hypothetical protein
MNFCLAGIGIHFPSKRAIAIGETLGVYRDYPVSKGSTSPLRPDLDQGNGESAGMSYRMNPHESRDNQAVNRSRPRHELRYPSPIVENPVKLFDSAFSPFARKVRMVLNTRD